MPDLLSSRALPAWIDPAALFVALERVCPDLFWLDAGAHTDDGWSIVGIGDVDGDPNDVRIDPAAATESRSGLPFRGGWVGWCDYESGAAAAGAPSHAALGASWIRVRRAVALDHRTGTAWALAAEHDLDAWMAVVQEPRPAASVPIAPATRTALARHRPHDYESLIGRCRELIRAGTAYQLCLTTRFSVPGPHDAVGAYLRLRAATPAHHGGFIRIAGRALLSASPEQFLHVGDGIVRTRPIKGTRPRGASATDDAALAAELQANVKERAENVMIVDLMRNDLSRVCVPGSIRVDGLWEVESYPAVHQLVSTVSGVAAPGTTVGDLLDATFPAGSMTGAPKLSAMTRLHELEGGPRGVYAGCFGHVGADGVLDLAMVIRSIVIDDDGAAVGAGGGITWGSIPRAEVAEVATKARAPLAALGAVLPEHWGSDILS